MSSHMQAKSSEGVEQPGAAQRISSGSPASPASLPSSLSFQIFHGSLSHDGIRMIGRLQHRIYDSLTFGSQISR